MSMERITSTGITNTVGVASRSHPIESVIKKIKSQQPVEPYEITILFNALRAADDPDKKREYTNLVHTLSTAGYDSSIKTCERLLYNLNNWAYLISDKDISAATTCVKAIHNIASKCISPLTNPAQAAYINLLATIEKAWQRIETRTTAAPILLLLGTNAKLFHSPNKLPELLFAIWQNNLPKGIISPNMENALCNHISGETITAHDIRLGITGTAAILPRPGLPVKDLFLSNLDSLLANKDSAGITVRLLNRLKIGDIINVDRDRLRERLSVFCQNPQLPLSIRNGLLQVLGITFDPLEGLNSSDPKLFSESISYLFTEVANQRYKITSLKEAKLIESTLAGIDHTKVTDEVKYLCYLISNVTYERKLLKNLEPGTVKTLCNTLADPAVKPALKHHICKSLDYLICMNSEAVLQTNAGQIIPALTGLTQNLTPSPESNEYAFSLSGCISSLAAKATGKLDQKALSIFTDAVISKLEILCDSSLGAFDVITQSLKKMSSFISLSSESVTRLIEIASSSSQFDNIQKSKILETLLNFRVNGHPAPYGLPALLDNLDRSDDTLRYLSLKVLNLFEPADDLLLKLSTKPLLLENIVIQAANSIDINNPLRATDQEHALRQIIKSEACMMLSSVLRKGYIQPDNTHLISGEAAIGNILRDKLSFTTEGELWLLKACIEIGNIDNTDLPAFEMDDTASASSKDSGIVIAVPLLYHIASLITKENIDSRTLIAAVQTLVIAASYARDSGEATDYDYILDCLNTALEKGYYSASDEVIENAEAAISFLEAKFRSDAHFEVLEEFIGSDTSEILSIPEEIPEISDTEDDIESETSQVSSPSAALIRTADVLIAELKQNNEHIDTSKSEQKLKAVNAAYEKYKIYSAEDIKSWALEHGKTASTEEIIAAVKRANFLHNNQELRDTQILSTLLLSEPENKGRLAEIKTGEGKSTTVAVLAIIHALRGKKVDVITSSHILAERDANDKQGLFEMFGLSVGCNHDPDYVTGLKDAYEADIVYGEATTFQHDYLRHEYKDSYTRGTRLFSDTIALVDEVDSMLIDESSKIAKIAGHTPGMEYLIPLMALIWTKAKELEGDLTSLGKESAVNSLKTYTDSLLSKGYAGEHKLILPKHLTEFTSSQTEAWAGSALRALSMKPDVDYVITQDEKGLDVIAPVDFENTGIVRAKTAWVDGLHQFLQMKHELVITSESLTAAFISNLSFFKLYGSNIYGLTGTLGSGESQDLLKKVYNVDTVKVPTYKPGQLEQYEGIVTPNDEAWMQGIIQRAQEELTHNRALLIICDTILAAKETESVLQTLFAGGVVRGYWRSDDESQRNVTESISSGEIIVATNLAGRGTDIQTTPELEAAGGLHVIVTFLPKNRRVEDQAFGRTARQGKKGSAELILNAAKEMQKIGGSFFGSRIPSLDELRFTRDMIEKEELTRIISSRIPKLESEDKLFKEYAAFKHELWKQNSSEYLQANLDEMWGFWLKKHTSEASVIARSEGPVMARTTTGLPRSARSEGPVIARSEATKQSTSQTDEAIRSLPQKFEEFKKFANIKYRNPANPVYLARHAYNAMTSGNYGSSFATYRQAISLDPAYSFVSSYNMAYAVVRENNRNSARYDDNAPGEVAGHLEKALKAVREVHIPQTLKIKQILQPRDGSPLARQIEAKTEVLEYQAAYIVPALSTASGMSHRAKIQIHGYKLLRDMFPTEDPIYASVVTEANASGLHIFYDLGAVAQPKRSNGFGMIASIATAAALAPIVGPWAAGFCTNAFMAGAVGATVIGGASRMVGAAVEREGRLDKAFKDVTSRDSLRSLGLEAISAGVAQQVMDKLKIGTLAEGEKALKGAQMHIRIAQQHAIRGVVHSAATGEHIVTSAKNAAINSTLASGNFVIGETFAGADASQKLLRPVARGALNLAAADVMGVSQQAALASTAASEFVPGLAAPVVAAAGNMLAGGSTKDMSGASHLASYTSTYNDALHAEGAGEKEKEDEVVPLSADELKRAQEIKSSGWYILRGEGALSDHDKALVRRYDKLFEAEIRANNVAAVGSYLSVPMKAVVNLALPEGKKLVMSAEEIAGTAASSSKNLVQKPGNVSNIAQSSRTAKESTIIRGTDGKILGAKYTQRHHVLHQQLQKHPLWKKAGMHVEDRTNKMLLPTTKGSGITTTQRTVHQGRHLKRVKTELEQKMDDVLTFGKAQGYTQAQYREKLQSLIRNEYKDLKSGTRILNKAEDLRKTGGNQ